MKYISVFASYTREDAEERFKDFIKKTLKQLGFGFTKIPKVYFSGFQGFYSDSLPITKAQFKSRATKLEPLVKDYTVNKNNIWNKQSISGDFRGDNVISCETYSFKFKIPKNKMIFFVRYSCTTETNKKPEYTISFESKYDEKRNAIEPLSIQVIRELGSRCNSFYNKFKKFAKTKHLVLEVKTIKSSNAIAERQIDCEYSYNLTSYFNELSKFLKDEFKNKIAINIDTPNKISGTVNNAKFSCVKKEKSVIIHYTEKP